GTLFSENTIGGSLIPACPYYFTGSCTQVEAKKYDLNFLRRYFLYGTPAVPYDTGTSSIGAIGSNNPIVIEYNPNVQNIPAPLFDIQE
ncbi:MAG: hypothetical protein GY828_00330, partial [Candidatus Gracilibacteria bacterium]|nr:hypothetical protein [Candidatus Gracilibacteria bacterium]